ncbi:MAG: LPS assembly protein LptD [Acidobacteria bacterium]|nr:LPS assembly protein LptD [Acidobacteriota bacterium]
MLALFIVLPAAAQQPENIEKKVENPIGVAEEEKKAQRLTNPQQITIVAQVEPGKSEEVAFLSEKQEVQGDVYILTGNVQVTYGDILVIADRATYNKVTDDLLAEGNVFFEQQGQRIAGERIELNARTKRGTIYTSTAFTNRTPDGTVIIVDSKRADKTGEDTFNLENAVMTACQERVPKWSFTAKRARIRLDHNAKVYNALFRVKNIPIFFLPYASVSISKKDRSSGFLLPSSGSSSIKGRTLNLGYYQTLGRSADILFRTDFFSKRGLGVGFDFRARPDENSRIAFGSFTVIDRLWGEEGPKQGGTSFYADAVQYFKNGFVAVADVNITSNFEFRQVFAENVLTAISPEERTVFYLNRNWRSFSFNALFGEQSSFIFDQKTNTDQIVKVRQLPSFELSQRSTKMSETLPFYFSFDSAIEGVRRSETTSNQFILKTPSMVQRMDFFPRLTFPLRSFAGFTLTPSIGMRSTYYSDSLDPVRQLVTGQDLFRKYAEVDVDLRLPAFSKVYRHGDGEPWFKHVIEPFIEYSLISGIDEFDRTLRIDERDVVAETNEITYGVSNSFLVRRPGPNGSTLQPHELLNLTLTQKYFFDPTFGGALQEGVRNQFFPINTLSGFAYGGVKRNLSPLNVRARLRPTQSLFADLRLNYDTHFNSIRDIIVGAGVSRGIFSISQSWYLTRRIAVDESVFDPSTFPGNQLDLAAFVGNPARGPYGGFALGYDLRNRTFNDLPRDGRLINLTATAGWAWDCCSFNVQSITFNAGVRNENRILFAFTLKGIGTIGTENIGQRRRR